AALATEAFLRAVLTALRRSRYGPRHLLGRVASWLGRWPGELVIPVPVDAYETYARQVRRIARRCGVRRVRALDEPVAAALGYGVDLRRPQTVLVLDFGGGTLNIAVVRLGEAAGEGHAQVLATAGSDIGGETVDAWLREEVARRTGMDADWVKQDLGWEVEWAKKQLSRHDAPEVRIGRAVLNREEFIQLLEAHGLYQCLADGVAEVVSAAKRRSGNPAFRLDEALLVGGSTLLPGVPECVERALGLRPRHWRPFEAVARGAAVYGAGRALDPVFYHDYAVRLQVAGTHPPVFEFERLIPAGSRYPTPHGQEVTRYYRVRPGLDRFSLPICEIGRFGWPELPWERRSNGAEYWRPQNEHERQRVRCLNEGARDLPIRPPSQDERPRLRVTYRVDDDRRLRVDVFDLLAQRPLLENVSVATLAEGGRGGDE
ncbi:MAG: Hsp70 family protein, partial [Armatimonadota bacterium]|nr:Hsp70 family protein [Armatimonadota bacterium]